MNKQVVLLCCIIFIFSCKSSDTKGDHPAYHAPAIQFLTDSIEANPENAMFYFRRAEALSNMELDSLALKDVLTARELDKKNPQYTFTIAYLQLKLDQPKAAIQTLQQHMQQSPGNVNARILLSRAYLADKNIAAAQQEIDKILAAAPQHEQALMMLAQVKAVQKDTIGAMDVLKNILATDNRNYDASFQLAEWYKSSGNPEAISQYQYTFGIDTLDASPLYEIGDFYERQKQWEKAKEAYKYCISKDMDYTEAYLQIGKILYQQDSTEKALRHFKLVISTMPNSADGYFYKGLCFEKLNQKDSAAVAYRQALVFDNSLEEAKERLKKLK